MDKKLPICIVLVMLMSCFSCKQPQQPTEDADMDTQWVDSSQHLYRFLGRKRVFDEKRG